MHIDTLDSKRCGMTTYCHSLVRPGYCPFCLGNSSVLLPDQRLQSWCRDAALWQHVAKHLKKTRWPQVCPHPLCDVSLRDGQDLRYHFIDGHGLSRKLPKEVKHLLAPLSAEQTPACSGKRKNIDDGGVKMNDGHGPKCVWPALCPHPLCDDLVTDDHGLEQHLVDKHSLSHSRPDTIRPRKRKHSDEAAVLDWAPEYRPSYSKRSGLETSSISPRLLSEPTSVAYHVADDQALRHHLVDGHTFCHSRPDTVNSRKPKHIGEAGSLEWTPVDRLSPSKRSRHETSTIAPRLLLQFPPAGSLSTRPRA